MRRALVVAALAASCYRPDPQEGAPCVSTADCPMPQVCDHGMCSHQAGHDAGNDARDARPDADPSCVCSTGNALTCSGGSMPCPLGCSSNNGAHCMQVAPSNGIDGGGVAGTGDVTLSSLTTFDVDSGAITGGLTRSAGQGLNAGIRFELAGSVSAPFGVFAMKSLTVTSGGTIHFTGSRAAIFIVATDAAIHGVVDLSATCYGAAQKCPGPGGGAGATFTQTAGGCGPGGPGTSDAGTGADTGGGGGGGGGSGAAGGIETATGTMFAGGTAGLACVSATLEPLVGGSGGGGGGPGAATTPTYGGGGGGGWQLTAFSTIDIDGTINAGGAGGETGPTDANNGGAGGGGGAGGSILLEAPSVSISGIVAANGGGGGGGSDHLTLGGRGANGGANATPAVGGAGANGAGAGGNGGALATQPTKGGNSTNVNAGAGGGGYGRIYLRSSGPTAPGGTISPAAGTGAIRTQ